MLSPRARRYGWLGTLAVAVLVLGVWVYDALGYRNVVTFEANFADDPIGVLARWRSYMTWHPTRHWGRTGSSEIEAAHLQDLANKARRFTCGQRLDEVRQLAGNSHADVEQLWERLQACRAEFPEVVNREDWGPLHAQMRARLDEELARRSRHAFEELVRSEEQRPGDLEELIAGADRFLQAHAGSAQESEVRRRRAAYVHRLDERDIEPARAYSANNPLDFPARLTHYQHYLDRHPGGGAFTSEARAALEAVARDWDRHDFRAVRDHFQARPGAIATLVTRCRTYLAAHPQGQFVASAHELLHWSERVTTATDYKVVLRVGQFDRRIARYFSRGPDLSVELEVGGIRYGPSTIAVNRYDPEWNYEFPRPVRWKLGDPVRVRVVDHDWKERAVIDVTSADENLLAMRLIAGEVWFGNNLLTFESDFTMPALPAIED